jgi:hypothetical protein
MYVLFDKRQLCTIITCMHLCRILQFETTFRAVEIFLPAKRWVGLRLKPNFFIYLVKPKPESDISPTYLDMF